MPGYHLVRSFPMCFIGDLEKEWALPEGWKPFSTYVDGMGLVWVIARSWVREVNDA